MGWEGPPFDMTELASLRGLQVATSTGFADDQDACVTPGHVLVNGRKHRVRQRYSIAHELGHTLFPDYEEQLRRAGRLWRRAGEDSELERLCQVAAAEFLLPLEAFQAAAASRGRTLRGALGLAADFDASLEATVRRVVETTDQPMVAVFLRPMDAVTGAWLDVTGSDGHNPYTPIGVSLACANDACGGLRIATGTPPPRQGAADRAWKRVVLARGAVVIEHCAEESWAHVGIGGTWSSEAVTLPKGAAAPHEVLCLLRRSGA